jgi:carbon monoxide dehydrogenase subunit G
MVAPPPGLPDTRAITSLVRFDGSFDVTAPQERVRVVLLDVPTLAACVPGAENVRETGPNEHAGTVKLRLGPMSTAFELTGTLRDEPDGIHVDVRGRERLTGTLVEAAFSTVLSAEGQGTRVAWALDVTLRGRLGQMGQAVFQDVARGMTEQVVACIKRRIESGG